LLLGFLCNLADVTAEDRHPCGKITPVLFVLILQLLYLLGNLFETHRALLLGFLCNLADVTAEDRHPCGKITPVLFVLILQLLLGGVQIPVEEVHREQPFLMFTKSAVNLVPPTLDLLLQLRMRLAYAPQLAFHLGHQGLVHLLH